jgi:hypothetical protein
MILKKAEKNLPGRAQKPLLFRINGWKAEKRPGKKEKV